MTKLSTNFDLSEFAPHDPKYGTTPAWAVANLTKLCVSLEKIRAHFQKPITITSGFRPTGLQAALFKDAVKKYGSEAAARVHVAPPGNSLHEKGQAADIQISGVTPHQIAAFCESLPELGGIGIYESWVHVDTRSYKARW